MKPLIKYRGGKSKEIPNIKKHYIKYCRQLRQIIRNGNYDAVHVNMLSAANIVPLKIACSEGVPKIIAHSHNTQTIGFLRKLMDRCNRARLKKYSNVKLACGYEAGEWLFGKNAMELGKAIVVNNAINNKYCSYFSARARGELDFKTCFERLRGLYTKNLRRIAIQFLFF